MVQLTFRRGANIRKAFLLNDVEVTSTAAELNLLDTAVAGTAVASKAAVLGANKNLDTLTIADSGLKLGAGAGTAVTATAAELNYCDVTTAGVAQATKALVLDANKGASALGIVSIGSSDTPLSLTLNTQIGFAAYVTQSATTASEFDAFKLNSVQTGAGAIAVGLRVNMESNVKLGNWSNAAYISLDLKTAGGAEGLGTAVCGELVMSAGATQGTFAVFEAEINCPTSWVGTEPVSFLYLSTYGDTKANFDDYGYLFTLTGVTSGAAHLWYDNQKAAPAVEEFVRVLTPSGARYLALYDANA